jgi:hypothetical protein
MSYKKILMPALFMMASGFSTSCTYAKTSLEETETSAFLHFGQSSTKPSTTSLLLDEMFSYETENSPIFQSRGLDDATLALILQLQEENNQFLKVKRQQEIEDADFAFALQLQEEEKLQETLARKKQKDEEEKLSMATIQSILNAEKNKTTSTQTEMDEDYALALQLQEEENRKISPARNHSSKKDLKTEEENFLKAIVHQMLGFDNADVHAFNRAVVRPNLHHLEEIEQRLVKTNSTHSFTKIQKEIRDVVNSGLFSEETVAAVENVLGKIQGYFTHSVIDPETGADVSQLLSRVWDLVNRNKEERLINFIESLAENIKTEGGCFPGVAGRLFRDYYTLTCTELGGV